MTAIDDTGAAAGSAGPARRELLDATYDWVSAHGWAGLALHPLADAVGSSPRVLLSLFGTEEGLVRALLGRSRTDQLRVLDALPDDAGLARAGRVLWEWLAAAQHRPLLRLWLGAYSRSLAEDPAQDGPWAGFARDTVTDWDLLLAAHQPSDRVSTPEGTAERALLLAVLRGALLDLLSTGDAERAGAAVAAHLRVLDDGSGVPSRAEDPCTGSR